MLDSGDLVNKSERTFSHPHGICSNAINDDLFIVVKIKYNKKVGYNNVVDRGQPGVMNRLPLFTIWLPQIVEP